MARPVKDSLDYFPKDTGFYRDRKIRALIGRFGSDGAILYDYILCEVYGDKGYYTEIDDSFVDIAAADLKMSPEKIGLILNYLLDKSMLLDGTLSKTVKVLTSHGIQTRWQEVKKSAKRAIGVNGELWLLDEAETEGFIQVRHNDSFPQKNPSKSGKNPSKSQENYIKESKVKESKPKETKEDPAPRFSWPVTPCDPKIAIVFTAYAERIASVSPMTERIRDQLLVFLDAMGPDCCIRAMDEAVEQGHINWKYVKAILEKKREQGVRSIIDWEKAEQTWAGRKDRTKSGGPVDFQLDAARIQKNNDWLDRFLAEQEGGGP